MATSRHDVILPTKHLIKIRVGLQDYAKVKEIFWSEKLYSFHIKDHSVMGDGVVMDIRAMRVNEFVDILDEHSIPWTNETDKGA